MKNRSEREINRIIAAYMGLEAKPLGDGSEEIYTRGGFFLACPYTRSMDSLKGPIERLCRERSVSFECAYHLSQKRWEACFYDEKLRTVAGISRGKFAAARALARAIEKLEKEDA